MAMIEVEGLTRRYQDRLAVDGLGFEVAEGEVLGFLGPNGAGKSTTLRMLAGFLPPSEGRLRIAGFDVHAQPREVKRRIGYLPETPPLYVEMSVRGYLAFVAALKGVPGRRVRAEVERVAQLTALTPELGRIIQRLSKGFRQRVGLAQALLGSPKVLLLDEPTDGLDPAQRKEVRALIRSLGGEHTVLLSSHVLGEVALTCERALILRQGRKVAHGDIAAIAEAHGGPRASLEEAFIRLTQGDEAQPLPPDPSASSPAEAA